MGRHDKLLARLLIGGSDANVGFDELCALLRHLGFEVYQVRQVRAVLQRYGLTGKVIEPEE